MKRRPEHPDDLAARVAFQQHMRAVRKAEGLSACEVSDRLGLAEKGARDLELKPAEWAVRRAQAWARALNHRLRLVVTGVTVPDVYDLHADLLAVATTFGALDEDRLHLLSVVNDLVRVREAQHISFQELADRQGVTDRAVRQWEDHPSGSQVHTIQRYCRALGGVLLLDVAPVAVEVPA